MARLHVMERSHAQAIMDDLHDALGRRLAVSSLAPCPVEFTAALVRMCSTQSCGKCTPCREGTTRMLDILTRITKGNGKPGDIEELRSLAKMIQNSSLCGLGKTAPNPVLSTLANFEDEYREHIFDKKCRTGSCRSLVNGQDTPSMIIFFSAMVHASLIAPNGQRQDGRGLLHAAARRHGRQHPHQAGAR